MMPYIHGGPDADGVPVHDRSSNGNACGPYPEAVRALKAANARHDPAPLRGCASLGLPGRVRRAVASPEAQDALIAALRQEALA